MCDVDGGSYDAAYPEATWRSALEQGILIRSARAGLVHLAESVEDLELVRRAK